MFKVMPLSAIWLKGEHEYTYVRPILRYVCLGPDTPTPYRGKLEEKKIFINTEKCTSNITYLIIVVKTETAKNINFIAASLGLKGWMKMSINWSNCEIFISPLFPLLPTS